MAIPDSFLGEKSCAFILLAVDTDMESNGTKPLETALRQHLQTRGLAHYKIPDAFRVLDEFPTTAVGKISRKALRQALAKTVTNNASIGDA
nr:hypothetical protein [Corynebacterium gerontici]